MARGGRVSGPGGRRQVQSCTQRHWQGPPGPPRRRGRPPSQASALSGVSESPGSAPLTRSPEGGSRLQVAPPFRACARLKFPMPHLESSGLSGRLPPEAVARRGRLRLAARPRHQGRTVTWPAAAAGCARARLPSGIVKPKLILGRTVQADFGLSSRRHRDAAGGDPEGQGAGRSGTIASSCTQNCSRPGPAISGLTSPLAAASSGASSSAAQPARRRVRGCIGR